MRNFFIDAAIELAVFFAVFFPVFCLVLFVLWKLRARAWTMLLGFVFQILFLLAGYAIAPRQMHSVIPHPSPIMAGIALGCGMPIGFMFSYHLGQWTQKKSSKKS